MNVETTIRNLITETVEGFDGAMIKNDATFEDSGLDSLDLATILLEVQETFDVVIAAGDEAQYDTLEKLVSYVQNSKS